ncbi:MAG: APC family permease [Gemmatimonadetes bacterium]|nr:APC family permease [Gemmatimonadota bacterium]
MDASGRRGGLQLRRSLGTFGLVFVMFFTTSGGAYGTEGLVSSVGPGMALLLMALVPVVWVLPEALLIGELASMLPEEGGYYRWVHRAFGPFWAFQNGWLTWLYSLVDMAIYPVLFAQYLAYFTGPLPRGVGWLVSLAMIWGATVVNLRGARPVGWASVAAGLFVLGGFLAVSVAAIPQMSHAPWVPFARPGSSPVATLGLGLSIALWNYIGWDNASTVEGEITDAGRTYPRALAIAVPLVSAGYLVPIGSALAATDWSTWREGHWPQLARAAAPAWGGVLAPWVALGGVLSALALFNALLLAYSRIPAVMADDGLLPPSLAQTDERGTPRRAVLAAAVVYSVFALVPFGGLVVADVVLYALALCLEFGALVALRHREPGLRGPFRLPLGTRGVAVLAAVPMVLLAGVIGLSLVGGEYGPWAIGLTAAGVVLGPVVYRRLARGEATPYLRAP